MCENKVKINHENFVAISKSLIAITDTILKNVVAKTEYAALEIGNKIETVTSLSAEQTRTVRGLIANIYQTPERVENFLEQVDLLSQETNKIADEIFERAKAGDLESASQIGDSQHYKNLGNRTKNLSLQLERLSQSDKELADMIAPVIMALQFQDSVRQSLENLIKCFQSFSDLSHGISQKDLPEKQRKEFWTRLENHFTTTDERNIIRKTVYGENAELIQKADKSDPFLF